MTTNETSECVRRHPDAADTLAAAREWCLDRYLLPTAHRITGELAASPARDGTSGTAIAFGVHFSRVWLALLLGSILMLDFGGAWTAMAAAQEVGSVTITFAGGLIGTLGYLFVDLHAKVRVAPEIPSWRARIRQWGRLIGFLGVCLGVTLLFTTSLWFLLTGTGEVVEGPGAVLHVIVWTGFALFVGVFFGLLAETG